MNFILNKILSLTVLGDIAQALNGKKTLIGVIGFVLSAVVIVLPLHFPELSGVAALAQRLQEFLISMGIDLQTVNAGFLGLTTLGVAHKAVKTSEVQKGE